jgi:hypothetical protein
LLQLLAASELETINRLSNAEMGRKLRTKEQKHEKT